jgi:hypothetical protein
MRLKNNFLKIKKYYFNSFQYKKHFEKQSQDTTDISHQLIFFLTIW